jgi:hypothetical protein
VDVFAVRVARVGQLGEVGHDGEAGADDLAVLW